MGTIPDRDESGQTKIKIDAFMSPSNHKARLEGILNEIVPAGTSHQMEWQFPYDRLMNGAAYTALGMEHGDHLTFEVVHPVYGVVDRFAKNWYLRPEDTIMLYPAKVYAGLSIRVTYVSTGVDDVEFSCNLFLHEEIV